MARTNKHVAARPDFYLLQDAGGLKGKLVTIVVLRDFDCEQAVSHLKMSRSQKMVTCSYFDYLKANENTTFEMDAVKASGLLYHFPHDFKLFEKPSWISS
jgi:hypothetical protein